ncbi:hypothetical protein NCCP2331_34610 [Sporosarcina sp. NCCP-2331]|nr:hypothetical protein NCCP2331_34610 [Sporosarcina sp. NCCP-2331]GLB57664.1 hypothetical protein NCCP2378_34540 [Sporosarcina sp. NCCP-2378]
MRNVMKRALRPAFGAQQRCFGAAKLDLRARTVDFGARNDGFRAVERCFGARGVAIKIPRRIKIAL